jgi:hypothetical protein
MSATSSFVDAVCLVLITNNRTLTTQSETSKMWNESNKNIGENWISGGNPDLIAQLNKLTPDNLVDFMDGKGIFEGKGRDHWKVEDWSMDLLTKLLGVIAGVKDDKQKDKIGLWNGVVTNLQSLIQSTMAQNTSTGDSASKACQSALQNASSAGQPASNAGDSVIGVLSNAASAQAQISA